jgi:hypothetical protein
MVHFWSICHIAPLSLDVLMRTTKFLESIIGHLQSYELVSGYSKWKTGLTKSNQYTRMYFSVCLVWTIYTSGQPPNISTLSNNEQDIGAHRGLRFLFIARDHILFPIPPR